MYLRSMYPQIPPLPPTNFHNLVFRMPEQQALADHVMQIDAVTGKQRTRFEFIERVYDAATAIGADRSCGGLGLGQDHMIGILSDNCLEYFTIVHALIAAATPMALFSSFATQREMTHNLRKSEATHMFLHASFLTPFLEAAREVGFPKENIFILEGDIPSEASQYKTLDSLIQNVRLQEIPREPVKPAGYNTLAYLVFSSGTSGLPKAVMISHGNLCVSLVQGGILMTEYMKIAPPPDPNVVSVILGFLPMYHTYGLHVLCLRAPMRRSTIVIMPRWNIDLALHCIPRYRVSSLALIPSVIHALVSSPKFRQVDLSSVVSFNSGAAYLPHALAEKMKEIMKVSLMMEGYGMSEATLSLINRPQSGVLGGTVEHHTTSSGILNPGVEALILREDSTHCLPDEPGDLYVKSGGVALGYWKDHKATKEAFLENGWLRTGDRFRADAKGNFWFEDRAKDTLKVSGLQVSPAELEDIIYSVPTGLVNDVAVAGVQTPNARTTDDKSPRAWIVLSEKGKKLGEARSREVIEEWSRKNMSKYKWLRGGIQFVDEIPKNPTGKILRRILQDQYEADKVRAKL